MYDAYHAAIRINQVGGNVDNYRSKPSFGLDHGGRSKSKAGLVAVGVGILSPGSGRFAACPGDDAKPPAALGLARRHGDPPSGAEIGG